MVFMSFSVVMSLVVGLLVILPKFVAPSSGRVAEARLCRDLGMLWRCSDLGSSGLVFRMYGVGFRGFRVEGLGLWVWGFRFRV